MKICRSVRELEEVIDNLKNSKNSCNSEINSSGKEKESSKITVGFVPTMGALHQGHISLVNRSISKTDITVVSIFVNPTQFNNASDLEKYPRDVESDSKLLEAAGVDVVFVPESSEIYPEGLDFTGNMPKTTTSDASHTSENFEFDGLDQFGEGPRRPGHFFGVVQVVTRLFDIVKPDFAFFGEKDFQQLAIIKHIVKKLDYKIKIEACPTLREIDGLAMSSRNMLLTPEQRRITPEIYRILLLSREYLTEILSSGKQKEESKISITPRDLSEKIIEQINAVEGLKVEYAELLDSNNLQPVHVWNEAKEVQLCVAVYAGQIRLIDNIKMI